MNRVEYMRQLEYLLAGISPEEREDAINYYNDYLDAGGPEKEAENIRALGSPEELARTIIQAGRSDYSENGAYFGCGNGPMHQNQGYRSEFGGKDQNGGSASKEMSFGMKVLIVLLFLCAIPVVLPMLIGIIGALFGVLAAIAGITLTIGICGAAALIAGVLGFFAGLACMFGAPSAGCLILGIGLIGIACGLLVAAGFWEVTTGVLPPLWNWILGLFRKSVDFSKKKYNECRGERK